jgi:hypothetical protein
MPYLATTDSMISIDVKKNAKVSAFVFGNAVLPETRLNNDLLPAVALPFQCFASWKTAIHPLVTKNNYLKQLLYSAQ